MLWFLAEKKFQYLLLVRARNANIAQKYRVKRNPAIIVLSKLRFVV
jgi:hypothetical protein